MSYWYQEECNPERVEGILNICEDDVAEVIMNLREDLLCALEELDEKQS